MVQRVELPSGRTRTGVGDDWRPEEGTRGGDGSGGAERPQCRERRERERREREKRGGRKAEPRFKFMPVAPIGLA
jgi:hypothetical protein